MTKIPNEPKADLGAWVWSPSKLMYIGREADVKGREEPYLVMRGNESTFSLTQYEIESLRERDIAAVLVVGERDVLEYELGQFEGERVERRDCQYRWPDLAAVLYEGRFWSRKV